MATTKLSVYNDALRAIGELRLVSLDDDVEARYVIDDAWAGSVERCFTEGLWNFATKTETLAADTGQVPIPGYTYVFDKPPSWLRTIQVSNTSMFNDEAYYRDEDGKIYATVDTLYIRYISNTKADDAYIQTWPPSFSNVVSAYIAMICGERISGSSAKAEGLAADYKAALASAKNKDAMDQPRITPRPGSWSRAMRGSGSGRDSGPLSGF